MGIGAGQIVTADDLKPRGVIYQGNRPTTKATAGAAVEVGVLRIDSMVFKAGRCYKISSGNVRMGASVAADHFKTLLRYSNSGAATTASTEIARVEGTAPSATLGDSFGAMVGFVQPTVDETGSVILTLQRTNGTGVMTIQSDVSGLWLTVEDIGFAVPDNGIDL